MIGRYVQKVLRFSQIKVLSATVYDVQDIADIKDFLPVKHNEHDALLTNLANSAKVMIEHSINDYLLKTNIRIYINLNVTDFILPYSNVESLTITDLDLVPVNFEQTNNEIKLLEYKNWIICTFDCGISDVPSNLPQGLKDAIKHATLFLYQNRNESTLPEQIDALINAFRRYN